MSLSNMDVLNALNALRQNPQSYISDLEAELKHFKGNVLYKPNEIGLQTQEGPNAYYECISVLKNQQPLQSYTMDNGLNRAAARHANDIGPKGVTGHNGSDGSTMGQRIEGEGQWNGHIGENINFGDKRSGREIICQLIVDDGVPSRGHRNNCLSKDFKKVGIALAQHKIYKGCCVFDFAEEFTAKGDQSTQGFNQPPPQYSNFNAPPQQQQGFNAPPQQQQGFNAPPQHQHTGFNAPHQHQHHEFNAPPQQQGFNAPPQQQQMQGFNAPPQQQQENQMPPGCVGMKTNTSTTTCGNKKTVVVTTTYTMQNGSTRTETNTTTTTSG